MPQTRHRRIKIPLFVFTLLISSLLSPLVSKAQLKSISGSVKDSIGAPIPDVSVTVLGSTTGTTTGADGRFTLNAAIGSTIVFSSLNYETTTDKVDERSEYNVSMRSTMTSMTDVIVVGYGKQKKVNLVGAVSTVNVDEKLTGRALPNISAGLTGLVPGLQAVQNSGMAGRNNASLLIRGLGTVNNSSPLIVVDGMPDVDINRININDIETVSVLKDATSASVYGSRAANGVILITTRSGKGQKKTAINFNSNMAIQKPTRGYQFVNDYARALTLHQRRAAIGTLPQNQQFKNGTIDQWMALSMIDPLRYPDTDWWDIIMQDGTFQNYNLSASGGNDKSNFFISAGVKDEVGMQINNTYKQYNARFNFDYKVRSNMNAGVKFNGNWSKFKFALEEGFTDPNPANTAGFDMQYAIAGITPYDPVTGYYGGVMAYGEDPQAYNPYTVYVNQLTNRDRQEVNSSMYFDWTPFKGLTGTVEYALNYYNQFSYNASTPNTAFNFQTNSFGSRIYVGQNAGISNNTNTGYKTMLNGRLNYHTTIGSNHDISALFVYSEEYWYDRFQGSSRNDRLHPSLREIDAALTDIQGTGGNSSTEGLQSYIGRVNYNAYGKYLLEGNFRVDGSSKFLPGSQFGFFPSVAVGWRFTEENFLKGFTDRFLTNGKLRVSYGELGNNSGVGRYEQQNTLTSNPYIYGIAVQRGFVNTKLVNPDLTWETTAVLNIGLELGFLANRLTAEIDVYDRKTTGMNRPSEFSILLTGAYNPPPRRNIGDLRNRGIEGTFSWKDHVRDFSYGITLNASYNQTELESWNEFLNRGSTFIGMPYGFIYTYETNGIAQTWQDVYKNTPQGIQPGDVIRQDLNGDGRIDGNDQKALPNSQRDRPTTFGALNGYASWKGIDVSFLLNAATGRKDYWFNIYNNTNFGSQRYASTWDHFTQPWSVENRGGEWPRLGGSGNNRIENTTFWLDDMSYVRLKNLQVGYTFSLPLMRRAGINTFRIAGSAENLWTASSFRGLDPESGGDNNLAYPVAKAYSLVLQLGF
ncbi:SusC/RagA family TonB-linked outer membrane protein [Flavitalea antarctica]